LRVSLKKRGRQIAVQAFSTVERSFTTKVKRYGVYGAIFHINKNGVIIAVNWFAGLV